MHHKIKNIKTPISTFRTLPLDRHKDEGKPSVLGRDDPDDHLLMIILILIKLMTILNIKTIHQKPPQSIRRLSKGSPCEQTKMESLRSSEL